MMRGSINEFAPAFSSGLFRERPPCPRTGQRLAARVPRPQNRAQDQPYSAWSAWHFIRPQSAGSQHEKGFVIRVPYPL